MTLQEIRLLNAFNAWATNRIFDAVAHLPEEEYTRDMKSSHGSIHNTLTHMVAAEKIWISRWQGISTATVLTAEDLPTLGALRSFWEQVGYDTAKFLGMMSDKRLQETFAMKTSKGDTYTHLYWQAFQHVVDHSTYHRGQIVTMMRQLGAVPPNTGLITFYRETAKLHRE